MVVFARWTRVREAPVEDGGHVSDGAEISAECRLVKMHEGMVAGFRGQGDQVSAQRWPGWLVGDAGHDLVGSAGRKPSGCRTASSGVRGGHLAGGRRSGGAAAVVRVAGTYRRFQLIGTVDGVRVFDDYAHHPTEVRNTLIAARTGVGRSA